MGVTAKELAQIMGLSEAAVSMALRNKPGVSTKTRLMVLEMAEKHGYDFIKVNKEKNQSRHIVFVIYKRQGAVVNDTPFFSALSEGIEHTCSVLDYKLQIHYFHKCDDVAHKIQDINNTDCAGLILLGTEMELADFLPFNKIRHPLVLLDAYFDSIKYDCVLINNVQGAVLATDYLIARTQKQPGYLQSAYSIGNFTERADGFYKSLRTHGMSVSKSIVHKLTPSVEGAFADMMEKIEQGEELATCYFADNDLIAIGAMKAFQKHGYKIPEDIAIIGFDDLPMTSYIEPPLATINVPIKYMGQTAVERLVCMINEPNHFPLKIEISTGLKKRRSV